MRVLLTAVVAIMLAGCEGEPLSREGEAEQMFEYDSKPVGDPGAETYRDEARPPGAAIEVPAGPAPSPEKR